MPPSPETPMRPVRVSAQPYVLLGTWGIASAQRAIWPRDIGWV